MCHEARLIVEIDGGQHDGSSRPEARRTEFLEKQGYRLLRFWNDEVLSNLEGVYAGDSRAVGRNTPTQPSPIKGEGLVS